MISSSIRRHRSERSVRLPGDDILPGARSSTQAITIKRPRSEVWPWLVQMGAGRAGWYSYDRIDNGGEPSQEHIVPRAVSDPRVALSGGSSNGNLGIRAGGA